MKMMNLTVIGGADGPTSIFLATSSLSIAFVIWTIVSILFLGIGIYTRKAKKPVGFWANGEPIQVKDVTSYNKAVSKLWIVFGCLFEVVGLPLLFMKQNSPLFIIPVLGVVFLAIGIMLVYTQIENKYRK